MYRAAISKNKNSQGKEAQLKKASPAKTSPTTASHVSRILQLQKTVGNRFVQQMLAPRNPTSTSGSTEDVIQQVKIFRIQGGKSRQLIVIRGGNITNVNEDDYIYIAIEDTLASDWRSKSNRAGANLLVMEVKPEFVNALRSNALAKRLGLPPAQQSQDPKWEGVSYAIKGEAWARFLIGQQDRGLSKEWNLDEYFEQFEEFEDSDTVWVYGTEEGEDEADGFESSYAEYVDQFMGPDYDCMKLSKAMRLGYTD